MSIVEARQKQLEALKARKEGYLERRREVQEKMKEIEQSMDDGSIEQIQASSSSARRNRQRHKDRATFDAKQELQMQQNMIETLERQIDEINEEIRGLEMISDTRG
jgi:predicted  nucleic acid-binding Zn-ribbon protein